MDISRKWLSDYVKLDCDDAYLCDKLTMAGIEVEKIEKNSTIPEGVVTAKILSREPHPGSDHLSVCKVTDGSEELQIVCGAPNCDAGCIVPLAKIGTVFVTEEGEFKIKRSKLRGVESFGMMCSEQELGISDNNDGLMIFPAETALGVPLTQLYPGDTRIELEITPNRPDCLSMWGVARDVSCLLSTPAELPEISIPQCDIQISDLVTVENLDLCPRYIGRVIKNVKVGPSPDWLKERLESIGLRSINNVVDVTNFVMLELGQPLHAFDRDTLAGKRVVARNAKAGEKITLLDGKVVELTENHFVIADVEKPMALAGIMGGENSGVTEKTTEILLESAVFKSSHIRSESRSLGISTDASYRYERGVDFDMAEQASIRACQLILATAGGELASAAMEVAGTRPAEPVINCRFSKIRDLIGTMVTNERIVDILQKLHLKVENITAESCVVTAPLFRLDLTREADLAEEVARVDGLDKIPMIPVAGKVCHPDSEDAYAPLRNLRDLVIGMGFDECVHYSIVGSASALADSRFEKSDLIELSNPLSPDNGWMRPGLLGEMLGTVGRNIARGNRDLRLFELDKVFCKNPEKFPEERNELLILMTGKRHPELFSADGEALCDFYDIKGVVETLLEKLAITNYRFVIPQEPDARFRDGHALVLMLEGKVAGMFGELNGKHAASWRGTAPVFFAQMEVAALIGAASRVKKSCKPLAQFPGTTRDIAFVAPESLTHGEVMEFIRRCKAPNFESVRLFDIFIGDDLKKQQKKSMAYSLSFRNRERTLTDNEVNAAVEKIRVKLEKELQVELR
ncbi:MAG: phenylalanine--tRNA ligase subunit beta [Lentisphaerae bacterium]|nr:phenylalanine--tRNA ligase subunit beta [Lentisphaerota bacterium]